MKVGLQFLVRLHGWLLNLYPHGYREEYGEELLIVFNLSLVDAAKNGAWEIFKVAINEFLSLPAAILQEHLRERRKKKMNGKSASHFDFVPGSRNETLAALAPFLLFGALPTIFGFIGKSVEIPTWMQVVVALFFWFSGLILFVIGFSKGAPRWFMPYLGLPLPIISLVVFNSLMEKLQGVWWYRLPWFLDDFLQQGLLWVGLIGSFVLLVLAVRLIPKLHPFYKRRLSRN